MLETLDLVNVKLVNSWIFRDLYFLAQTLRINMANESMHQA
jgi:hypothetical protein